MRYGCGPIALPALPVRSVLSSSLGDVGTGTTTNCRGVIAWLPGRVDAVHVNCFSGTAA